jgi:acyl-CoA synthetase (AMP-forming)/AMP-acid ligase II
MPRALLAMVRWGPTLAGGLAGATARYPQAIAIADEEGDLTYRDLWTRSDALARGLQDGGIGPGRAVGILARNHRGFVMSVVAASKLGADLVFLNTGFAGPQLADVTAHESLAAILHDDEFAGIVRGSGVAHSLGAGEMTELAARTTADAPAPSRHAGRVVILTSGTTGRPKGATRSSAGGVGSLAALLSVIPIHARDTRVIAAPLFHAWGLAHLGVALGLSSTVVLRRQFDPEATLAAVGEHHADGLVVVPVMLQRMLALGSDVIARHDTSSLRYLASSGAAIPPGLVTHALERFGPVLYNAYGSTEVALATIATPADLQAAPSTAGRPPPGSLVRVLDGRGDPVERGVVGRIFVGSDARFEGYTGGGGKESVGGLLASGDLGHLDAAGRLFIDGREDEMIVSGGENVFPAEIEALLSAHPAVADAGVIGVPDEEFGQRLRAFVVLQPGSALTEAEVKEHVRANLARYKVPRDVVFAPSLPRTTTGKLRRADLG